MFNIEKYLEKFKYLRNSKFLLRDLVASSIKEITNIEIDPKKIDVKNGIARVNEKPIIKNEIFIKKIKILNKINKNNKVEIHDIL